jgi:hypothetical protein
MMTYWLKDRKGLNWVPCVKVCIKFLQNVFKIWDEFFKTGLMYEH